MSRIAKRSPPRARPTPSAPTRTPSSRAGFLFCSGQIPLDPETGELVGDTPGRAGPALPGEPRGRGAPRRGAQLADAVRLTVYLTDMGAFGEVNEVYGTFFETDPPARVAFGVAALPRGAQVEIDAVIALPD